MSDRETKDELRPGEDGISYWRRISQDGDEGGSDGKPEEYWNGPDDHGFRPPNHPDYGPVPEPYRVNGMTKAALACGILSLLSILFGYGMLFACLGILFALLSRGKVMAKQAKAGLAMCAVSLGIFAFSLIMVIGTLTAGGAWPALMEQASVTDFSDPVSVQEFESAILDSFYRSLMPAALRPSETESGQSSAGAAASGAESAPYAESAEAAEASPGGGETGDTGSAGDTEDTGNAGESSAVPFSLPPGGDTITV